MLGNKINLGVSPWKFKEFFMALPAFQTSAGFDFSRPDPTRLSGIFRIARQSHRVLYSDVFG